MLELRQLTDIAMVIRIFSAVLIGGVIGLERGRKNRPAGFRTYMLVCVGSCLIMIINQYVYQTTGTGDPLRLGAQVISGIGFLGAGTIVVTRRNQIKGLTTAAGLWAAAGVGLTLGIGYYEAAITTAIAIYLILTVLHCIEVRINKKAKQVELYVELRKSVFMGTFIRELRELNLDIENIQTENDSVMEKETYALIVSLKSKKRIDHGTLLEELRGIDGVVHMEEL